MAFYKIKSGRVTGERGVLTFVGEVGHLFYSQDDNTIRISDGHTPGGIPLSGGSITFISIGAPPNPQDGQLWFDPVTGRLYVWYDNNWVDASPDIASTATGITLSMLTVGTGSATGGGALSYDNTTGVFTFQPADLSTYATQGYVTNAINNIIYPADNDPYTTTATVQSLISNSLTNFVYTGTITYDQISGVPADNDPYTTTATVTALIANSLTNYATQVYVNSQGFITADIFTTTNISTFINDAHYLQVETGVHSVTGTANQVIVTDLGNRDIQLSTPQNLNSTATVTFGNLTVNNLNVLNTLTSVTPVIVDGYRIYLASSSTQDTQINGGGIVLGTSTWTTGLLYSLSDNYWYTIDSAGFQTEHLIATKTTVTNLTVLTNADIGYSNLQGEFANALLQIDAANDSYAQVNFQNHSSSTWASGDFVVTNDIGTDGKHYIDMGINSSRYSTSSWVINGANDGYLYIDSGNLAIGTTASNVKFFVGPTDTADSIVASMDRTGLNVDSIKPLTPGGDIVLISTGTNAATVHVPSLSFPNGGLLITQNQIEAYLTNYTLTNIVTYSTTSTDALTIGQYGIINGVAAPYAVFNLNTNTEVVNLGDILAGQSIVPSTVISKGSTGTTFTNYIVVDLDMSILGQVLPVPGAPFTLLRQVEKPGLDIQTRSGTDIFLNSQGLGDVLVNTNILPIGTNISNLGSPTRRWKEVWVGPGSIYVQDETLGSDLRLTAINGDFVVAGAAGLNVGQFTLRDNNIYITDPTRDINIGVTNATGFVNFNRPVKIQDSTGRTAFTVGRTGLTTIIPPTNIASTQSALSIIGNSSGLQQPRNYNNTMLQITGLDSTSTRVSIDSFGTGTYPIIAGRQAGGTVSAPTRTISGDTLFRISTQGWGDTGYISSIGRLNFQALQDFTNKNAGTGVRFQLTPLNTTTIQTVTADITATGLSFVGNDIGGITFRDSTRQITAWTSTATVLWSQITGVPAIGVTSITTGTGIRVDHSTGTVNISWANDGGYITSSALTGYATQNYVLGLGYTTTATVTSLIANSLTNYATQTYVTTRGYITSSSLSVTTGSAVSGGALAYSTTTGVFTFNPATAYTLTTATNSALGGVKIGANITAAGDGTISVAAPYTLTTGTASALGGVKIGSGINAAGDGTISVTAFNTATLVAHAVLADTATTATNAGYAYSFNTGTLVTTAVTANTVAGGYVSSITAGTGTQVSTSTGAVTVWALPAQAITSTGTTTASNYTLDLSGPTFVHWQPSANGNRTITLSGFTPGRKVELWITPHATNDIFTVTGVTASQCSNGHNTFTMNGVGASQQNSFIMQFYCTTDTIGGVWIYGNGSL